jgi:glycosyl hydrolase family 35
VPLGSLAAVALVAGCLAAPAHGAGSGRQTHTIDYDRYSFSIDGERVWLWSAEFHYFRLPNPDLWRDQLEKFKAAGFNAVSLYFSWAYHSPAPGVFDFSGVRDIERLLATAGLGAVDLVALGNTATSLRVRDVRSPG